MNSKERIKATLDHRNPDRMAVDFGATVVTGIHCKIVGELRRHYGLEDKPVKIIEPGQMLGEVDDELQQILHTDCVSVMGRSNKWGLDQTKMHEQTTPWGQRVLIADGLDLTPDKEGDVYFWPRNDHSVAPSGKMPDGGYFVNYLERCPEFLDEENLKPEDSIEEFGLMDDATVEYFGKAVDAAAETGRAVVAGFGGTALGDVANVPGIGLLEPKGIRSIAEWYMSSILRPDYIRAMFEIQTDRALVNLEKLWKRCGSKVDVVYLCGTDFGTQDTQFCSEETFREIWLPYYQKVNGWIHANTTWKTFKHSCGSVYPLIPCLIESGFDILNPVQINAKDMDPQRLKDEFGADITFWGGGVDTQKVLPFGTPSQIREHILRQWDIFGKDGGFVFNSVHNVQANVPIENVVAMIDAINEIRGI